MLISYSSIKLVAFDTLTSVNRIYYHTIPLNANFVSLFYFSPSAPSQQLHAGAASAGAPPVGVILRSTTAPRQHTQT